MPIYGLTNLMISFDLVTGTPEKKCVFENIGSNFIGQEAVN